MWTQPRAGSAVRQPIASQRGIALVIVLWGLVLLAVIAAAFTTGTRTEVTLARNLVENAKARAMADAGVYRAIWDLLTPTSAGGISLLNSPQFERFLRESGEPVEQTRRMIERDLRAKTGEDFGAEFGKNDRKAWRVDGTVYVWFFGGGQVEVTVQDEGGKVDLNASHRELLRGLLLSIGWVGPDGQVTGLDGDQADALVDAIADFRDPDDLRHLNGAEDADYEAAGLPWGAKDAPFEAVQELQQVLGMTPLLYSRLEPLVTVYSGQPGVDPRTAPRGVLRALPGLDETAIEAVVAGREEAAAGALGDFPEAAVEFTSGSRRNVVTIRAVAATPGGSLFIREAVVELAGTSKTPFRFYSWRQGQRLPSATDTAEQASGRVEAEP